MRAMKKSGFAWIGDIPSNWTTARIGGLYEQRNEKVSDRDYAPLSVTMKGIVPQLDTAAKTGDHDNRKLVRKGDFAINSRSDRRGSCGISPSDGSVSLINTVLKPHGTMCPDFYNYVFHTPEFADEFYRMGHGIVDDLWTTRWADMKTMRVPVPSLEEQQRIAGFLDGRCAAIDAEKAVLEDEVAALQRLRKSLVYRAITKGLDNTAAMRNSGLDWAPSIPARWTVRRLKTMTSFLPGFAFKGEDIAVGGDNRLFNMSRTLSIGKTGPGLDSFEPEPSPSSISTLLRRPRRVSPTLVFAV